MDPWSTYRCAGSWYTGNWNGGAQSSCPAEIKGPGGEGGLSSIPSAAAAAESEGHRGIATQQIIYCSSSEESEVTVTPPKEGNKWGDQQICDAKFKVGGVYLDRLTLLVW